MSVDEICEELEVDVCLARLRLLAARRRLREQDTAENCAAVVECRARLDVVLELLLELKGAAPAEAGGASRVTAIG
jgi:hypothetical protein